MIVDLFDTETTALIANGAVKLDKQPRIVEIYAEKIDVVMNELGEWEFHDVSSIDFRVNPMIAIPKESSDITGITTDMVKGLSPISKVWPAITNFFKGSDMIVAHNLSYDKQVMEFEQRRIDETVSFPFGKELLCTVEATMHLKGHRLKLVDLHKELFGENFEGAHGAKADVLAMKRCFIELWKRAEI